MSALLSRDQQLRLSCFLLAFLCASSNTLGFDGFFHAISSSSIENIVSLNPPWVIEGFHFPRYILFHYIFFIVSLFGLLPFYFIISLINGYILFKISLSVSYNNQLLIIVASLLILHNFIFISALGFSISWIFLWYLNKNKKYSFIYLVIGSIVHPVGLCIGVIISVINFDFISMACIILLLMLSNYLQTTIGQHFEYIILQERVLNLDLIDAINRFSDKKQEILLLLMSYVSFKVFSRLRLNNLKLDFLKLIFIGAILANIYSIDAQLRTGGLWWALFAGSLDEDGGDLVVGKQNIVMGSFFTPKLFDQNVVSSLYYYKDSQMDILH